MDRHIHDQDDEQLPGLSANWATERISFQAEDLPTPAASPSAKRSRPGENAGLITPRVHSQVSTGARARGVFDDSGIKRLRLFSMVIVGWCVMGLAVMPIMHGDPLALRIYAAALSLAILGFGGSLLTYRKRRPPMAVVYLLTFICAGAGLSVVHYWGVHSPALLLIMLTVVALEMAQDRGAAIPAVTLFSLAHIVLFVAIETELIADRSLQPAKHLTLSEAILSIAFQQMIMWTTVVLARFSRRSIVSMMNEVESATRSAAVRDVLLREARAELEMAIGGPGLLTDELVGEYRLGNVIGRGGMGEVYAATHALDGTPVAVKVLQRNLLSSDAQIARFFREARAVASLDHDSVVKLVDVASPEDPIPYIVMERLRGRDLGRIIRDKRRLSLGECVEMVRSVGRGLEAAHRAGIVHRDLKPQNLFYAETTSRGPVWKILDFGVSKHTADIGTLTGEGVVGTPGYMAPEQAAGIEVDGRADIYALAAIVYRCLTGNAPFPSTRPNVLEQLLRDMPQRPGELVDIPRETELVLAVGLARDPDKRFKSAVDFAEALEASTRHELQETVRAVANEILESDPWLPPERASERREKVASTLAMRTRRRMLEQLFSPEFAEQAE